MAAQPLLALLEREFPEIVSMASDDLEAYGQDWSDFLEPRPGAVALPRTTREVSRLLAFANAHRIGVVPSGGRTGLAGGAVATNGEVVLSLSRMRRMDPIDEVGGTVRVQAGAPLEAVHAHCAPHGLIWPIDLASKGSCQIGGNIATNAGGVKVVRYGLTRQWVLGLEVVLASGEVLQLNGALEKNNTGLDLRQLFIGSEGTLGVITEATLKLTRKPGRLEVFLFAARDLPAVLSVFREARRGPFTITAFEMFDDACLSCTLRHRPQTRAPFAERAPYYVLLEIEVTGEVDVADAWAAAMVSRGLLIEALRAQHTSDAAAIWAMREGLGEAMAATGKTHKNDVSLPIAHLAAFSAALQELFATTWPGSGIDPRQTCEALLGLAAPDRRLLGLRGSSAGEPDDGAATLARRMIGCLRPRLRFVLLPQCGLSLARLLRRAADE